MPRALAVHAACFAIGAAVGGGIATAVSVHGRRSVAVPSPATPSVMEAAPAGATKALILAPTREATSPALKFGHPGPTSDVLVRRAYTAAYDRRLRHPAWTAEHLTLSSLGKSSLAPSSSSDGEGADRSKSVFVEDGSVPQLFRAKLEDYFRSGYDRGHMIPAADAKISQEAMDETFLLTNIAPQVGDGFNRHYWAYLEDWCRRLTHSFADVYVFTVPLYLPHRDPDGKWRVNYEMIGSPPNVSVPTHFAKVVLGSRPSSPTSPGVQEVATGAFVLPNTTIPDEAKLESFVMPVEAVERAAGLTLFSEQVKSGSKHICQAVKCEVIVRRFDEARKRPDLRRTISAPK